MPIKKLDELLQIHERDVQTDGRTPDDSKYRIYSVAR